MSSSDDRHPPGGLDPDHDPDQLGVRRLLADLADSDARDPAPVPADVAARLDTVLAELADPGAGGRPGSAVVPLRRRWAPLLATAAAVVVVAGGGALLLTQGGQDATSFDSAGSSAASAPTDGSSPGVPDTSDPPGASALQDAPQEESGPTGTASSGAPDEESADDAGSETRMVAAPYVSLDSLSADVTQLVADGDVAVPGAADTAAARERVQGSGCVVPVADRGAATLVMLEGDPAVLVVGQQQAGARPVEVLSCADGSVVGQAQVPAG